MPILRDAKELPTRFGAYAVATGAMGEFGPILLITAALSSGEGEHGGSLALMLLFTAICRAHPATRVRPRRPQRVHVKTSTCGRESPWDFYQPRSSRWSLQSSRLAFGLAD
jgi:hypothetical protein